MPRFSSRVLVFLPVDPLTYYRCFEHTDLKTNLLTDTRVGIHLSEAIALASGQASRSGKMIVAIDVKLSGDASESAHEDLNLDFTYAPGDAPRLLLTVNGLEAAEQDLDTRYSAMLAEAVREAFSGRFLFDPLAPEFIVEPSSSYLEMSSLPPK